MGVRSEKKPYVRVEGDGRGCSKSFAKTVAIRIPWAVRDNVVEGQGFDSRRHARARLGRSGRAALAKDRKHHVSVSSGHRSSLVPTLTRLYKVCVWKVLYRELVPWSVAWVPAENAHVTDDCRTK